MYFRFLVPTGTCDWNRNHGIHRCFGHRLPQQSRASLRCWPSEPLQVRVLRFPCPGPRLWPTPSCRFCWALLLLGISSLQPLRQHFLSLQDFLSVPKGRSNRSGMSLFLQNGLRCLSGPWAFVWIPWLPPLKMSASGAVRVSRPRVAGVRPVCGPTHVSFHYPGRLRPRCNVKPYRK